MIIPVAERCFYLGTGHRVNSEVLVLYMSILLFIPLYQSIPLYTLYSITFDMSLFTLHSVQCGCIKTQICTNQTKYN